MSDNTKKKMDERRKIKTKIISTKSKRILEKLNEEYMSQGRFEANMANDTSRFYLLLFIHNFLNSVYI